MAKNVNRRTLIILVVGVWLVFMTGFIFDYEKSQRLLSIYDDEYFGNGRPAPQNNHHQNKEPLKIQVNNNMQINNIKQGLNINDVRSIDSHSLIYDYMFETHDIESVLKDLSFKDRCDLYFKSLYLHDNNWFINPNEDLPVEHKNQFKYEDFERNERNHYKDELAKKKNIESKDIADSDPELEKMIKEAYDAFWLKTLRIEQTITNLLSHLRIFNKCYVTQDESTQIKSVDKLINREKKVLKEGGKDVEKFVYTDDEKLIYTKSFDSCTELESRIYRWLSFAFPIYERWTGAVYLSPPEMSKFVDYPEVLKPTNPNLKSKVGKAIKSDLTNNKPCFLNQFKNSLNGKGIVLSIGEQHVDDTVRLMFLLRALRNHYPIQIVYYDDLTIESKTRIINAARNRMTDLPQSFEDVRHQFPDDYVHNKHGGLPQQEVWFVNTYNAIHPNYKDKFKGYSNKFLTALFNSFEEYMLIDADTILLENPDYFFGLDKYFSTGAFFYKDRTAPEDRPESDCKFFEKITPSIIDNLMFDIPIITQHTLGLHFFQGLNHYMESGLVLTNHRLHFNSILTMVQMNFFGAVLSRSFGDKELFWLSFAVTGDEMYEFNKYFAGAIGNITPKEERLNNKGETRKSEEICASHPGHVSDKDDKLVWFNSGFKFCAHADHINYNDEVGKHGRFKTITEADELEKFYQNPIAITGVIIPPFDNPQHLTFSNNDDEPNQGWYHDGNYCQRHLWCAYSSIGGRTSDGDNTVRGTIFRLDEERTKLIKFYGDMWVSNE